MADANAALLALLSGDGAAFESNISQGQVPNPQQLCGWIQGVVSKATPMVGHCHPQTAETMRGGFASIGWDVAANGPMAGSQPPDPNAVLAMLKMLVQRLGGSWAGAAAPQPAAAAPQQAQAPGLPPGWHQQQDPGSGRPYYVDPQGQSHWELPAPQPTAQPQQPPQQPPMQQQPQSPSMAPQQQGPPPGMALELTSSSPRPIQPVGFDSPKRQQIDALYRDK